MFEAIYLMFNFVIWSFSTLLWLIGWIFIIIAIITFIGFINVQFFTKNNAEFSKILKEEQNSSLRFQLSNKQNSSSSNDSEPDSDDIDGISNPSSFSRRSHRRHSRPRKSKQQLPADMEPTWTMSKRMKNRERRRYREESPPSPSSASESIHSISASVSASVSQYKSHQNKPCNALFEDDSIDPLITSDNIHNANTHQSSTRSTKSMISPDINQPGSTQFKFKLTPRIRRKRKEQINIHQIDGMSQTDDVEMSRSGEDNEELLGLREDRNSMEIGEDVKDKGVMVEFDVNKMKCFDDIYDFIADVTLNGVNIDESVQSEIQSCIDNEQLELKSFEKALLVQKLLEL